MKLFKSKYGIKYRIARLIMLGFFIAGSVVLIVESATPGPESGRKSDATGTAISNVINDIKGDVATEIFPEECHISVKKTEFFVGESVTLTVNTLPEDSTYKSYIYTSSDEEVATVNSFGEVSFLKAGTATISAFNTYNEEVNDSVVFTVKNIEVESFTSVINAEKKEGIYQLEVDKSYLVTNTFKPENATIKDVTYEYDTSLGYISLNYDTIKVLKKSDDVPFDFTVKCGELTNVLQIVTYEEEIIEEDYPLVGFSASNVTKYFDQTSYFTPTIKYNPTYVSEKYKGYTLSSANTSIVTVDGLRLKPTGTIGSSKITITSTYDPSITGNFTVNVTDRPTLSSITIGKYNSTMYVDGTQTITVSTTPSSGVVVSKTFSSSNTSVATINGSGKITAKAVGTTTITVSVKDTVHNVTKSKTIDISVIEKPVYVVTDIEVGYKHGEQPILIADISSNLKNYFYIKTYVGDSNPANKDYYFDIDLEQYPGTLEDKVSYTPSMVGKVEGYLIYKNSNNEEIYKTISFVVASNYQIIDLEDNDVSSLNLYVGDMAQLKIATPNEYGQTYHLSVTNPEIANITFDGVNIYISVLKSGSTSFKIIPVLVIDDVETEIDSESKSVSITSNEVYTTSMSVTFTDGKGNEVILSEEESTIVYIKSSLKYSVTLDDRTTKSDVTIETSDDEIIEIKNNTINMVKLGDASITIKENESGLSKTYQLKVRNKVVINPTKAFIISGIYEYDAESNVLTITNGNSVVVRLNIDKSSTYNKVNYSIDNTDVALIGNDGTITPVAVGETTLRMTIQDELSILTTSEITVKIIKKNFIEITRDYMIAIRKGLGHFGAFAILAIFGTIAFYMFFRKELFAFGEILNFLSAFGLAYLTEHIQRFTPGRWSLYSDVILDFEGYSLMAGFVSVIILLIAGIKFLVRFLKKRKAVANNDIVVESTKEETKVEENKDKDEL